MRTRAIVIGVVGGLVLGGMIGALSTAGSLTDAVPLREDGGQITRVVMQYRPAAGALVAPIYAQFLSALGPKVDVVWVVGNASDADDLRSRLGPCWPAGRCRIVAVGKAISTWSKDRFVAMAIPGRQGAAVCCAPARTRSANPLRTNDQEVPYRLALDAGQLFGVRGTDVDFDGGDFLAADHRLFASPAILDKNRQSVMPRSLAQLGADLNGTLHGKITWLGDAPQAAPPHHIGMYLTLIGRTAAVGDVRMAEQVIAAHPEMLPALQVAGGIADPAFRAGSECLPGTCCPADARAGLHGHPRAPAALRHPARLDEL